MARAMVQATMPHRRARKHLHAEQRHYTMKQLKQLDEVK
jgi:hypothetical protein